MCVWSYRHMKASRPPKTTSHPRLYMLSINLRLVDNPICIWTYKLIQLGSCQYMPFLHSQVSSEWPVNTALKWRKICQFVTKTDSSGWKLQIGWWNGRPTFYISVSHSRLKIMLSEHKFRGILSILTSNFPRSAIIMTLKSRFLKRGLECRYTWPKFGQSRTKLKLSSIHPWCLPRVGHDALYPTICTRVFLILARTFQFY